MTTFTTRLNLPRPAGTEPADGPDAFNDLTDVLDPIIPPFAMGAIGVRPAPTKGGSLYYATDEGLLYFATGAAWIILNAPQSVDWKTGDMKFTGRDDLEAGWLWARGQAESRSSYPALWAEYGVRYGPGDGSTTFGMPDTRGRALVGLDVAGVAISGAASLGDKTGVKEHALTAAQSGMPGHGHGASAGVGQESNAVGTITGVGRPRMNIVPSQAAQPPYSNAVGNAGLGGMLAWWPDDFNNMQIKDHIHDIAVAAAAAVNAASAHPNVQPVVAVNVMVKT